MRSPLLAIALLAAIMAVHPSDARAQTDAVKALAAELRSSGQGVRAAEDRMGRSGHLRRLDERRRARHPARAARKSSAAVRCSTTRSSRRRRKPTRIAFPARENAVGAFRNDGGWKNKSYRQTSLVIEPENGRTPAFTPSAQKRAAAARPRQLRRGPVRHAARLHALRSVHHARHRRLGDAGRLRQRQPHHPGAGHGRHQLRDGARHARHLHRRPRAREPEASGSGSATRAAAGKATRS